MGGGKGRAPCCDKNNVKKGPWSPAEDLRLAAFIQKNGHANWRSLPKQAGLARCGKSCRLRWINYLSPSVKRGNFTPEEEEAIIELHSSYGNKWSKIAYELPGRTDNEIKNVWNTHLKKRVTKRISDNCHKDDDKLAKGTSIISSLSPSSSSISNVSCGDVNVNKELNDEECGNFVEEIMTNNHPNNNKQKQTSRLSSFSSNVSDATNLSSSSQVDMAWPNDEMEWMFSHEAHGELHDASNDIINNELFLDSEFDMIWNVLEDLENSFDETPNEQLVDSMQSEWLRYLENNDHGEITGEDDCNPQHKVDESGLEEMSSCLPLWPPSPHNFNI